MNSNQIMDMVSKIADTSGKNDKQALLAIAMEDPTFAKVMNYTYNPFITYGIRPKRRQLESLNRLFNDQTWTLLDNLASRRLTGDAAKSAVSKEMNSLDSMSAELLWRIINKDMKAGFSENSINKVSKDFIPCSPYQRCSLPKDVDFEGWPWAQGVISQIKADGMFFNGDVESELVSFTSRQGQPFPVEGFEQLMKDFADTFSPLLNNSVYPDYDEGIQTHGELLVKGTNGEFLPREVGNGLINKLCKGTPLPEGHSLFAELWNIIPKKCAVKKGHNTAPYLQNLRTLNSALGVVKASRKEVSIQVIETKVVRTYADAMEHYYAARRCGLEGTIAKKTTLEWKDGTSKDQVKLKQEVPVELEVEGFEEGKEGGKTADTFGSLKCKSKCGALKVNVGSGFSDELRAEINANRDDWMGAIITVKANEIMYAKRGKLVHSLFLPIYVERRFDKTEADTFDQIVTQFENAVKGV